MKELLDYATLMCHLYPNLEDRICDFVELCINEIEEGESVQHEIDLCMEDIKQLIEESCNI